VSEEERVKDYSLFERCRKIATATWSDALDQLKISGVVRGLVQRAGADRVVGRARTALEHVAPYGAYAFEDFAVGSIFDALGPGEFLVVDMGGTEVSTFGGLAALTVSLRKAAGVLVDGACRDAEELGKSGLWIASRHLTPTSGKGRVKVLSTGAPVQCGGVIVRQGDLIIADATGIVVVPAQRAEEVLALAEELTAKDDRFAVTLHKGGTFREAAASLKHA
jgi:regulator of RNase E activity RraA